MNEDSPNPETTPETAATDAQPEGPPLVLVAPPGPAEKSAKAKKADAAASQAARNQAAANQAEESPFSVTVGQVYDGPLDLLLDLIRKQDIDIYDIPIAKITAQFLAYVNQLKASDVDVAGEFIYTASLLIHIKSKMLLPRVPDGPETPTSKTRAASWWSGCWSTSASRTPRRCCSKSRCWKPRRGPIPAWREFKDDAGRRAGDCRRHGRPGAHLPRHSGAGAQPAHVQRARKTQVTVGQMIQFLARRLTMEDKPVALRRLLSHTKSERALVAMFLALLELVRLQAILLRQDQAFTRSSSRSTPSSTR